MAKQKHTHKYIRQQLKYKKVWRCALDDCPHFMMPALEELLIGRRSICWGCGKEFKLSEENMKHDMPECGMCDMGDNVLNTIEQMTSLTSLIDSVHKHTESDQIENYIPDVQEGDDKGLLTPVKIEQIGPVTTEPVEPVEEAKPAKLKQDKLREQMYREIFK